jgi:hypothetical protein
LERQPTHIETGLLNFLNGLLIENLVRLVARVDRRQVFAVAAEQDAARERNPRQRDQ